MLTMDLTFALYSMDGDTVCLDVVIFNDTLVEGDETFTVTLTLVSTDQGVTTGNNTTAITITDDEGL